MPLINKSVKASHPARPQAGTFHFYVLSTDGHPYLQTNAAEFDLTTAAVNELIILVKKASVGTIPAGSAVYAASWNAVGGFLEVEAARSDSQNTMPAIGVAEEEIGTADLKPVVMAGHVGGINTGSWAVGDPLYVDETTAGALKNTAPQGPHYIQKVAQVAKSDGVDGVILVFGAGRVNALPNLAEGKVWYGDANGVPQEVPLTPLIDKDYQAEEDRTTTDIDWSTRVSITVPAGVGKKYIVEYTCKVDANNKLAGVRLYNSTDAVVLDEAQEKPASGDQYVSVKSFVEIAAGAVQKTIALQWRTPGADTIGIRQARLLRYRSE